MVWPKLKVAEGMAQFVSAFVQHGGSEVDPQHPRKKLHWDGAIPAVISILGMGRLG